MPELRPQVCIHEGKLAVFIGGSYQFMTHEDAKPFVRLMQGEFDKLSRLVKRNARLKRKEIV